MHRVSLTLLLALLLVAPVQAAAQGQWEQQVLDQLQVAGQAVRAEGYTLRGDPHTGTLRNEASEDFTLVLDGGVHYALVGVCDNDCTDVDLALMDDSGTQIDSDYELDDYPVVEVTPPYTARYSVHVYMAECSTEPCWYGVGVFAGGVARPAVAAAPSTENHRGRLELGDSQLPSNEYYDQYTFWGGHGDVVVVDLFSSEFDPYLILVAPSGADVQNDDYAGSANRSRIEQVLDESGEWRVLVTSYRPGESGAYEVSITTVGG
jgi:hypothetical protein